MWSVVLFFKSPGKCVVCRHSLLPTLALGPSRNPHFANLHDKKRKAQYIQEKVVKQMSLGMVFKELKMSSGHGTE